MSSDVDFDRTTDAVRAQRDKYAAEQRLRDAAPELLEACRSALSCLTMDSDSEQDYAPEIHQLRETIAKAEGSAP